MEKITLKLFEFYGLDADLNGIVSQTTGEKVSSGLLQEKLPLTTKYWLTSLGKTVAAEKAAVEELKNELIKKFGKADDNGNISIPMMVDETDAEGNPVMEPNAEGTMIIRRKLNPDFQQFEQEFNELLQTEKELEYKPFKLSDFEKVETSENYTTFFQLVQADDAK